MRGARRMAESAALLVDELFPQLPIRQWVLSMPVPLRFLLAREPQVMGTQDAMVRVAPVEPLAEPLAELWGCSGNPGLFDLRAASRWRVLGLKLATGGAVAELSTSGAIDMACSKLELIAVALLLS